jgi:hypothetical protein
MGLLAYFVTPKVDISNFYKDLEKLLNWVDSDKKIQKQNKNEEKQKRE